MGEYKLSAMLKEHDDDVRGVVFPHPSFVLSASRDATVRLWKLLSSPPPRYDCTISSHVQSFVNAVTYLPPSSEHPEGLIISGGKDTIIDVRAPGRPPEADAERLLLGHAHNVCALDASIDGQFIVSGSWDGTARIWDLSKGECEAVLEGHDGSVLAVLAYDRKTIITGCADKSIRLFDPRGKKYGQIKGSEGVVRALCRLPTGNISGADIASAGNDAVIRLWKLNGSQVAQLHGHESFIYSLVSLPSGELVSSGEDRSVRVWRGDDCIQTITHPAISVWDVAACTDNGDIVSGASDRIVRIFSRDKERQATPDDIKAFEDSVKSSAIPKQQVGNVNKEQLPGPDFLQKKAGMKDGQVQMIREPDGSISAHTWSQGSRSWTNVGTVVDAAGSSGRKTSYGGNDYDYVFDVDIEDGKPPLKLPYNLSQNPYEAATKFLQDNELPMTYLDQVTNFITTNSQGAAMGQMQTPAGADPWGTEARYRPGEATAATSAPVPQPTSRPKVLPQKNYLSIKTGNLKTIMKKTTEFNEQLIQEGSRDIVCSKKELLALETACNSIEAALSSEPSTDKAISSVIPTILRILSSWPPAMRLPILDLARLLTAVSPEISSTAGKSDIVESLLSSGFEDKDRENNVMLAVRGLGNCFETKPGQDLLDSKFDNVHEKVKSYISSKNRNTLIAIATLYINYAVQFTSPGKKGEQTANDRAVEVADDCIRMINGVADSEAVYRSLVAVGTVLNVSEEVLVASKEIFGLDKALERAEQKLKEPRIKSIVSEIRDAMEA